jgi:hypothetical protein
MKDIFKAFEQYRVSIDRPGHGYITQEERQRARKRNRKKRKKK